VGPQIWTAHNFFSNFPQKVEFFEKFIFTIEIKILYTEYVGPAGSEPEKAYSRAFSCIFFDGPAVLNAGARRRKKCAKNPGATA
jgi:hypothetical protein